MSATFPHCSKSDRGNALRSAPLNRRVKLVCHCVVRGGLTEHEHVERDAILPRVEFGTQNFNAVAARVPAMSANKAVSSRVQIVNSVGLGYVLPTAPPESHLEFLDK